MDPKILEMRRKRTELIEEAEGILDKAESEKRDLDENEDKRYKEIIAEVNKNKESESRYVELKGLGEEVRKYDVHKPEPEEKKGGIDKEEHRDAFMRWMRHGDKGLADAERRALVEDSTGQILVPEDLEAEIIRALPTLTIMRELAGVRTTTRDRLRLRSLTEIDMGWGKLETGSDITEGTPVPSDEYMYVEDLAGLAKIGRDELSDADASIESYLVDSFSQKRAEKEDTAFTVGTGHTNKQPAGVAVNTSITTVNLDTADTITVEDLIELIYAVPAQYRKNGAFLMHSQCEMAIRSLRWSGDGTHYTGGFLWEPSVQAGRPNTLLGHPVHNQDDMNYPADAVAANVIVFGDFKAGYKILDRAGMTMQRLDELYAESGMVGFLAYFRVGGGVVRTNAFRALYNNT